MSKAKEQNKERPNGKGSGPTRSFDGSTPSPGSQIDRYRWQLGDGPAIRLLKSDLKEIKAVVFKLSSLKAAVRYLESKNMLGQKSQNSVIVKTPDDWEFTIVLQE